MRAAFVPGRLEVLGKHTDYAGGRSLLAAVERGIAVAVTPRDDAVVRVRDVGELPAEVEFSLSPDLAPAIGEWSNYPMTVARRIACNFPGPLHGAEIAFASDLPRAAGLSSSSALIVAVFWALSAVNALPERADYRAAITSPEDLAGYLGAIENGSAFRSLAGDRGVGTAGGSEDHTAILCARPDELLAYSFAPIRFERAVPVPDGYVFAIAVSGVRAPKTGAARERYNRASALMDALLRIWRAATRREDLSIGAALASDHGAADALRDAIRRGDIPEGVTREELLRRLDHFELESVQLIPRALDALDSGDLRAFGEIVERSQRGAEELLGNQVPETIELQHRARKLAAPAASAFGAGFGGSVWALIDADRARSFADEWINGMGRASAFVTRAAAGLQSR